MYRTPEGKLAAEEVDLSISKGDSDFNVHVVKDSPQKSGLICVFL